MARGTTTDVTYSGATIIAQAFDWAGIYGPEDPIPAEKQASALKKLEMMIKVWQGSPNILTRGLKIWQRERASLTLSAKISFDLQLSGGDLDINPPVSIKTAMLKTTDDEETPIDVGMTFEEFEAIPNKTETGTPSRIYYERQYDKGVLYLDIIPDDITNVIDLVYLRPLYDFDAATNDPDFPQHWLEALYMNLGLRIMPGFGKEPSRTQEEQADTALALAQTFYPETTNIFFEPDRGD